MLVLLYIVISLVAQNGSAIISSNKAPHVLFVRVYVADTFFQIGCVFVLIIISRTPDLSGRLVTILSLAKGMEDPLTLRSNWHDAGVLDPVCTGITASASIWEPPRYAITNPSKLEDAAHTALSFHLET